ncbi:hypothetical protein ACIBEJ_49770 [Nonomuraea sp. NPDC050790]|uniref:hypothetical protein n=1 Tax=Nonomuraea sp. NPDC050790 TaxID=3364371 RepID=UPI0037BCBB49
MSLKKLLVGLAVTAAALGTAAIPAQAQTQAAETFTGHGSGLKPPPARSMARANAYADASAAGYGAHRCHAIDSSLTFENGIYDATLTISCS